MKRSILSVSGILLLGLLLLLTNGLSSRLLNRFYIDLTEEGLYSLSAGSANILKGLHEPISLRFYFSKTDGSKFPAVKMYGNRVLELLQEYQRRSNGLVTLETYDPRPDTEDEEWAQKYGLTPLTLPSGDPLYFGLVAINTEGREEVHPLFDLNRQEFLEYDVTKMIYSLNQAKKPIVGILSPLPIKGEVEPQQMMFQRQEPEPWIFVTQLEKFANIQFLDKDTAEISDAIDVLLVVHPKNLAEQTRYALDQYVVRGGKAIIAVDPYCGLDRPQQDPSNPLAGLAADRSSALADVLGAWGVSLDGKKVVGDINLATRVSAGAGSAPLIFPVWLTLDEQLAEGEGIVNQTSVITSQLNMMMMAWPGSLNISPVEGLVAEPLLATTSAAMLYEENDIRFGAENPQELLKKYQRGDSPKILAVQLRGTFKSAFKNKPGADEVADDAQMSSPDGHLAQGTKEGVVIVLSDADFLGDQFAASVQNVLGTKLVSLLNDNITFAANAVENLSGSTDLISLRSRGRFTRPFTKVLEIEANAQERWKQEEASLQAKLNSANQRLSQLQSGTDASQGKGMFTNALMDEIQKFRDERADAQRRLRQVRRALREDKEALGSRLFVLNTFLIPTVLIGISLVCWRRRQRRIAQQRGIA